MQIGISGASCDCGRYSKTIVNITECPWRKNDGSIHNKYFPKAIVLLTSLKFGSMRSSIFLFKFHSFISEIFIQS